MKNKSVSEKQLKVNNISKQNISVLNEFTRN